MKRFFSLIWSTSFLFLFSNCEFPKKSISENSYQINGVVSGFPEGTKLYLRNLATDAVFDSTTISKNEFTFTGKLFDPPEQVWITGNVDNNFYYTNLLVTNNEIKVEGDISDFPWNVNIVGSKVQENEEELRSLTKLYDIKRDSLVKLFLTLSGEEQLSKGLTLWNEINKIDSISKSLKINYIQNNPNTYASIIQLGYLKTDIPKKSIRKIYSQLKPEFKNSKYAKIIKVYLDEEILGIGNDYEDFEGLNQDGKLTKFSSLRGQKYTLLNFTSGYCEPCILAASELKEANKTLSKYFNIVSFSGDPNKENWLNSIERDEIEWVSIWDGKGRFSKTSILYDVQGYPTFVLIDPKGIIIDKWSGYKKGGVLYRLNKNFTQK